MSPPRYYLPPAALVLLAIIAVTAVTAAPSSLAAPSTPAPTNDNCRYAGSLDLEGSTTSTKNLDHFSASSADRILGQTCAWTITCPIGSFIGATRFDFQLNSGDSVHFANIDPVSGAWAALDTWSSTTAGTTGTRTHRRFLYPSTNKVLIQYNTSSSSTGYGFDLTYKCFTSTCPAELVALKTYSTAAKSGFELVDRPVSGTTCSASFTCTSSTTDRPWVNYVNHAYVVATRSISITGDSTTATIPTTGNGNTQLAAASSFTINYAVPEGALAANSAVASPLNFYDHVVLWGACHPATETLCKTGMIRNGAELSGYGLVASDPDGEVASSSSTIDLARSYLISKCEYKVSCGSSASGIDFTGAIYSASYGDVYIRSSAGSSNYLKSFTSTSPSIYTYSGTTAYIYMASTSTTSTYNGGYARYSCRYSKCYSSSQSGLHARSHMLADTTLKADTLIPMTTGSQVFNSDGDGPSYSYRLTSSSQSGQECEFSVTCPTGFFVMLNVTYNSRFVKEDKIVAAGGGKVYEFSYPGTTTYGFTATGWNAALITKANTLTWTQSSNYNYYGYGYGVTAGCTSFAADTCPMTEASHFSALTTDNLETWVALDTLVTSASYPGVPVGYKCAFPVTCPAGSYIQIIQGTGVYPTSNTNGVTWTTGSTSLPVSSSLQSVNLGVNSATLNWATTRWNVTSSVDLRGVFVNVSCTASMTAAPPVTPAPATPVPFTPQPVVGNDVCSEYSGSTSLTGSTTTTRTLSHYYTSVTQRHTGDRCAWTVTCPTGSSIGVTDFDFMLYNNDFIEFSDASATDGSWKALDTWSTYNPAVSSGYAYSNRRFLYSGTNKLRVAYNASTSGSTGYGFKMVYKCFTSTCPADFVSYTTYNEATQTGFAMPTHAPAPGVVCNFNFTCANPADWLAVTYVVGADVDLALTINGGSSLSHFSLPSSGSGTDRINAASSSYEVSYKAVPLATQVDDSATAWNYATAQKLSLWVGCQPATESTCNNVIRNGATLSGTGIIQTDIDSTLTTAKTNSGDSCGYDISCPAGTTSIKFSGTSYSSTSYGTLSVKASATSSSALKTFSSSLTTYTYSGSRAHVTYTATGAYWYGAQVEYTCVNARCSQSAQSGLHGTTKALSTTAMQDNTVIAMTTGVQDFKSDADGVSSSYRLSSAYSGQECQFTVTCPTGYNVMLNVSGRFVYGSNGNDRIYATGGGEVYDFSYPRSSTTYFSALNNQELSLVTKANSLTWTQSAHYYYYGYGYNVQAGCTSFQAGTCPWSGASTHFAGLAATGTVGNAVRFESFATSYTQPTMPVGYSCSWPITCPTGAYVKLDFSLMGNARSYVISSSNPNAPTFKTSTGSTINVATGSNVVYLGVNSVTMSWATTRWNTTSYYHSQGFSVSVSCTADLSAPITPAPLTPTPTNTPTPGTPAPTPNPAGLNSIAACPYTQTSWALTEGTRHAMTFDFARLAADEYTTCALTFSCPAATTTGIAYKITTSPGSGNRSMSAIANSSASSSSYSTTTLVYNSSDINLVTPEAALTVTAYGTGGSFSMMATCLTTSKVPANGYEVNYDQGNYYCYYGCGDSEYAMDRPYLQNSYGYNVTNSIQTDSTSYYVARSYEVYSNGLPTKNESIKTLQSAVRRSTVSSYETSKEKAFLISCYNKDMTNVLSVVQLKSITGSTGTAGDILTVTALDSGISRSFGGASTTISETFGRSADTTLFNASSQYYFTWSSDADSDASPYTDGVTVAYQCAESDSKFVAAGVGSSVANAFGAGTSGLSLAATLVVATVAAVLAAFF